jgi:hypothetical protein
MQLKKTDYEGRRAGGRHNLKKKGLRREPKEGREY